MTYSTIEIHRNGKIGWLRLNRPHSKNAFSALMFDELHRGIDALIEDNDISVIILIGNGGVFSSGRDFRDKDVPSDFEDRRSRAFAAVEHCPKPTIAAVAGYAITGGLTLALACDIIISADNAIFQDTHAQLGIITLRASRVYEVLGPMRTKELLFTSRRVTAREALEMGLVNRVVPIAALESATAEIASEISRHDPVTLRGIKAVINDVVRKEQRVILELEELAKRRFSDLKSEKGALAAHAARSDSSGA